MGDIIIIVTITTALLILRMTELFEKQHDGFWTSELHVSGFESCQ